MTTPFQPPYRGVAWDDALEQIPAATVAVTRGLLRAERWLRTHATTTVLTLSILEGLHRTVFADVFPDFAGRLRGPAPQYIPISVTYGPHRGELPDRVLTACERFSAVIGGMIRDLDLLHQHADAAVFDAEVTKAAAYAHCECVRIHPFVNRNGRIARLCLNYFAARYGYLPIPIERPKADYLETTAAWITQRNIEPFVAFLQSSWERQPDTR